MCTISAYTTQDKQGADKNVRYDNSALQFVIPLANRIIERTICPSMHGAFNELFCGGEYCA